MKKVKRIGRQTVEFGNPPVILATAAVVGPKEGQGPLVDYFDEIKKDSYLGQKTWERAESKLLEEAANLALQKAGVGQGEIDFLLAGDLLNQIISSNFAARSISVPFFGLYGACSTLTEGLALGAMLVDGGFASCLLVATSSHHDAAERQYRYPTELGVQRYPASQWTVTGAGAAVLGRAGEGPVITHATVGKVTDMGVKDANDMGTAMAPAAADTIFAHLKETGRKPEDYDLIVTGDLARVGLPICRDLISRAGLDVSAVTDDCGILIYDEKQDVHAGGSGCGCSATVFGGYLMKKLRDGEYRRILLVSTGALHSPTTSQQGESIPGIAHAVAIEMPRSKSGGEGR